MPLSGSPAVFHLSSEGAQALKAWIGKRSSFPALMISSDTVGAWILLVPASGGRGDVAEPVMLLKWNYVTTVTFEMSPEQVSVRAPIGFHPRD